MTNTVSNTELNQSSITTTQFNLSNDIKKDNSLTNSTSTGISRILKKWMTVLTNNLFVQDAEVSTILHRHYTD